MPQLTTVLTVMVGVWIITVVGGFSIFMSRKLFGKRPKLERALIALVVGIPILGVGYWLVSQKVASRSQERETVSRERAQRQAIQHAMEDLTVTSHAVRDWKSSVCKPDYTSPLLTTELQTALLQGDGRPVLITGLLRDMRQQEGQYVLTLSSELCRDAQLRIELTVNADEAGVVLAHRTESPPYYALAAHLASVEKAGAVLENGDSVFVVHGQCSSLVFTGWDGFSIDVDEGVAKQKR